MRHRVPSNFNRTLRQSRSGSSREARSLLSLAGCEDWSLKRARNMLNTSVPSYENTSISQLINVFGLVSHVRSKHIRKTNSPRQHAYQRSIATQLRLFGAHDTILQPVTSAPCTMNTEIKKTPNVDTVFGHINYIRTLPHY